MKPSSIPDYHDDNKQSLLEKFLYPVRNINRKRLAKNVSNKTILITGASYGIGNLLAEILSDFETRLILVARTEEKLELLQQQFINKPCKIFTYCTDLRDESQINYLIQNFKTNETAIDILINNAGKSIHRGLINSLDRFHDTQRCTTTNFTGPVQLLLGILPEILALKGQIVNVSTLNSLLPPTAGWSAYQSSKVAFDQWLKCMEPELRIRKVMVSSVYLPLVRTRMSMVNEKNHKRPAMSKEKAAYAILNCITYKKRKYRPWWTGVPLFLSALFPNLWYRLQVIYLRNKK